jgi:hypothetical protein
MCQIHAGCARYVHESDANVARTCRARKAQQGMLLLNSYVNIAWVLNNWQICCRRAFCESLGDTVYKEGPKVGRGCVFIDSRVLSAGFRVKWGLIVPPAARDPLMWPKQRFSFTFFNILPCKDYSQNTIPCISSLTIPF